MYSASVELRKNMFVKPRKKLLFLSARLPLPLNTGAKIRSYHILKALCAVFDVTVVSFYGSENEAVYLDELKLLGAHVIPVLNTKIDQPVGVNDVVSNIMHDEPITVKKYWSTEMSSVVGGLFNQFDAIHCEHLHMAQYLVGQTDTPKVLNAHNVESMVARRVYESEKSIAKKMIYLLNYRKMCRFEESVAREFAMVLTVSENDKAEFRRMGSTARLETVENGVDDSYFTPSGAETDGSLVFVGSMDWLPNDDGILHFLDETYPALLAKGRRPHLFIVGRNPSQRLLSKAKEFSDVTVTGTVDDVRPFVDRAVVYVVPLRFGGGTRLKILEAFAMKKAVVSTSLGCEGIECEDGKHILIADSRDEFVASIERLFDDAYLRSSLGQQAQLLIEHQYSWEKISQKVVNAYRNTFNPS